MKKLIFWEVNEINFDYVQSYIEQGELPHWKQAIEKFGLNTTLSEQVYEQIEPWIQWPTVRTGMDYSEHQVFRLGDMALSEAPQHWEQLEQAGFSVAAVSPINGANRTQKSPFWLPDPWVDTPVSGGPFAHRITAALRQAVNDNSEEKLTMASIAAVMEGLMTRAKASSWLRYVKGVFGAVKRQHWSKAVVLDRLLSDVFIALWKKHQPDFSVLFLNGGAHVQHHYMCSAAPYKGKASNPEWYVPEGVDPLLEMLQMYDEVLADLLKLSNTRLMIATGMQQVPYEDVAYYWRLRDHAAFLQKIGIDHVRVQPRMTRDFLVEFKTERETNEAERKLLNVVTDDGKPLFEEVDNRGNSLFVTLTWAHDIVKGFAIVSEGQRYEKFDEDVVFVAIKNAHHHTLGYYLDTDRCPGEIEKDMPLKRLHGEIMEHFGVCERCSENAA
ncbi:conserved hypothetical protein [gamma proteobacterium HTCC5015]|nr:conserved hypothetical protein [gamma proteobacterium HTCC5015]